MDKYSEAKVHLYGTLYFDTIQRRFESLTPPKQ